MHHKVGEADIVMNERFDRFLVAGRWIEVPVAGLFVLRDGRIALWRDYFDAATYRSQTASSNRTQNLRRAGIVAAHKPVIGQHGEAADTFDRK